MLSTAHSMIRKSFKYSQKKWRKGLPAKLSGKLLKPWHRTRSRELLPLPWFADPINSWPLSLLQTTFAILGGCRIRKPSALLRSCQHRNDTASADIHIKIEIFGPLPCSTYDWWNLNHVQNPKCMLGWKIQVFIHPNFPVLSIENGMSKKRWTQNLPHAPSFCSIIIFIKHLL